MWNSAEQTGNLQESKQPTQPVVPATNPVQLLIITKIRCCKRLNAENAANEKRDQQEPWGKAKVNCLFTALKASDIKKDESWYMYSGASSHMSGKKEWFKSLRESVKMLKKLMIL